MEAVRKLSHKISLSVFSEMDSQTKTISAPALLTNIFCLYGFGAAAYIIPLLAGPYHRGFFCDDESIRYKYHGNTISGQVLVAQSLLMTISAILVSEFLIMYRLEKAIPRAQYRWRNSHVQAYFVESAMYFGYSQIGYISQLALTQVTKYTIGRLRPHFIDVCKPTNYHCNTTQDYISEYTCEGDPGQVLEGRLSFFSGHSATSMYSAVFTILYLQARLGGRPSFRVLLPMVQTFLLIVAAVICYTRITDHWHHWSDVLFGATVGVLVAYFTAYHWADLFSVRHRYGDPLGVQILGSPRSRLQDQADNSPRSSSEIIPSYEDQPVHSYGATQNAS